MTSKSSAFSGNLALFNITHVLQLISSTRRSGILRLHSKEQLLIGEVVFQTGQIINANYADKWGMDAVFALLKVRSGTFEFMAHPVSANPSIHVDTTSLLLDGLMLLGHANRHDPAVV